jgi:D-serine deaminase-like pyridoxal phosphate-dependent protein
MLIDDLSTPCVLVSRERLERNLREMQTLADTNDVALRPHAKTHKCTTLAHRQQNEGAAGLTVATMAEAEAFVEAGIDDIRVAYPVVGRATYERLAALMDDATLSFTVDTVAGVDRADAFFSSCEPTPSVLLEIDVGHGRCGVPWDGDVAPLAQRIADSDGLRLAGILTHAGQAYHGPREGETAEAALCRASRNERDRMLDVAVRLAEAGVPGADPETFEISIGSTPTMACFENAEREGFRITEIRPGNYVFHDTIQVDLGAAALDDCALTVYTTVVSKRRESSGAERAYVDAGKKVMTTDTAPISDGYGTVLYNASFMRPHPHAVVTGLSEEHGWMRVPGGATFGVGDRLQIVPNHACVTTATQSELHVVDGEEVVDTWAVDARGW